VVEPILHHPESRYFSHTNRIDFPCHIALAMMLVIVCDFPVPGGLSITRLIPQAASMTELTWEGVSRARSVGGSGGTETALNVNTRLPSVWPDP
jgi:hypothetical protein